MRRGGNPPPRSLETRAGTLPLLRLGLGLPSGASGPRAARVPGAACWTLWRRARLCRAVHVRPVVRCGRWRRSRWAAGRRGEGRWRGHRASLGRVTEALVRLAVPVIEEPTRAAELLVLAVALCPLCLLLVPLHPL